MGVAGAHLTALEAPKQFSALLRRYLSRQSLRTG